ncbi:hypothetical protein EV121DRAFT_279824 [Schizophyllum commune]
MPSSRKRPEPCNASEESDGGRLPSPPKRAKASRAKAPIPAEDVEDDDSAGEEQPKVRRSTRARAKDVQTRKERAPASGDEADRESEEETRPIDKFGSSPAVAKSVTTASIPQVDFRQTLLKSAQAQQLTPSVAKPVPRKIFLAQANKTRALDESPTVDDATAPAAAAAANLAPNGQPSVQPSSTALETSTTMHAPPPPMTPAPPPTTTPQPQGAINHSPSPPVAGITPRGRSQLQLVHGFVHHPKHDYKAGDYTGISKQLILRVCREYEALIMCNDPFPDSIVSRIWFKRCWDGACLSLDVDIAPDDHVQKLVIDRGSRIRGDMVRCTREKVEARFGFTKSTRKTTIRQNIKKYDELVKDGSYLYQNEAKQTGYCESKLISIILGRILFGSQGTSFAVVYRKYFDPIPAVTLSLVYAMIRHCIGEWATGRPIRRHFSEDPIKKERYLPHVKVIKDWVEDDPQITKKIRLRWYKKMRAIAGIDDDVEPVVVISEQARARARAALSQRTGDTDTEEEEDDDAAAA